MSYFSGRLKKCKFEIQKFFKIRKHGGAIHKCYSTGTNANIELTP